jgi:DNA-directed RNA polymerase subunit RPC12/RpoP
MNAMPVIRCERCGAAQHIAVAHATRLECPRCGNRISITLKTLLDPVIAAGSTHRIPIQGAVRRTRA